MVRHIFPYNFFELIQIIVWRKKLIKINTVVSNPLTFITMIITNMRGIYFDEKRENVNRIIFRVIPKIIANIQMLKFTYQITNNFFQNLLCFDEYMYN